MSQHQEYQPIPPHLQGKQPAPTYAPPPQKQGSSTLKVLGIIGLVVGLVCLGGAILAFAVVGGAAKSVEMNNTEKASHVTITDCRLNEIGMAEITYKMVNSSSSKQTYLTRFVVEEKSTGTRLGETYGIATELEPGKEAVEKSYAPLSKETKSFSCKLAEVN